MNELNPKIIKLTEDIDNNIPNAIANLKIFIRDTIAKEICVDCEKATKPNNYKKKLDRDEYYISGICEKCQPLYFGGKYNGN
jgi:hypothetical protein|tara:strand:- start:185 stop:430 length:246 start_codon:yes stop_codon:yes gene_type:complete